MDLTAMGGGLGSFIQGVAAIALIFWLVATVASFIVEMISSLANTRGEALRQFTIDMLQGELRKGNVKGFTNSIVNHPLMRSLEQPLLLWKGKNILPSYVPSTLFAQSVIDRLLQLHAIDAFLDTSSLTGKANEVTATQALGTVIAAIPTQVVRANLPLGTTSYSAALTAIEALLPTTDGSALVAEIKTADPGILDGCDSDNARAAAIGNAFLGGPNGQLSKIAWQFPTQLPATIANIQMALARTDVPAMLAQALNPLLEEANHDLAVFSNKISIWYDQSMQRASGWYRRYTVGVLAVVGFVLAVAFNIDTPRLIIALASDPALRSAGYAAAVEVADTSKDDAARQAMPLQLGFVRAAEDVCKTGGKCSESEFERLASLTLAKGQGGQILVYYQMLKHGSVITPYLVSFCGLTDKSCSNEVRKALEIQQAADKNCAAAKGAVGAACAAKPAIGIQKQQPAAAPKADAPAGPYEDTVCEIAKAGELCPSLVSALASDPRLFWYPGLSECLLNKSCLDEAKDALTHRLTAVADARDAANASVGALDAYTSRLPGVGWMPVVADAEHWTWLDYFLRIPGWLLTALATCIGAPFWFDLMQTIVNRRGAGPKPAEAKPVG